MCIVVVAFGASERYPLMIAANRDERHARPAAPADWWQDRPDVLAGRDLVAGGTWLGLGRTGRVAAVTNIFEPARTAAPASRGRLVSEFLAGTEAPADYARGIGREMDRYGPFNLLLYAPLGAGRESAGAGDRASADVSVGARDEPRVRSGAAALVYLSNRNTGGPLAPGLHVFGNNAPGEDWPKLELARAGMRDLLETASPEDGMLALLAERDPAPGSSPRDSIFVLGAEFGTRSSSVVLIGAGGTARFVERRFGPAGRALGTRRFEFRLESR